MARYRRFDVGSGVGVMPTAEPDLDEVRVRRAGLKAALSNLELALAAPAQQRVEWVAGVRDALTTVREVWCRHIAETEAPGAFLDELVEEAPRLARQVSQLRREHNEVLSAIRRSEQHLGEVVLGDAYDSWADDVRSELTALLVALVRHRQRGADLVYEAYDVDIGGGF